MDVQQINELKANLAQNVIAMRKAYGWSQDELAEELGVSRATVNRIEQQHHVPPWETICRLADVFEVSTDSLRKKVEKIPA